jgi:shikimate kinase
VTAPRARAPHLVLVGLMGAGKSTVGRACAALLERPFVDTDDVVAALAGMPAAELLSTRGEPAFRELECRAVADVCASPDPLVVACGGGAVVDPRNRMLLRETGVVVWLRASTDSLVARVGGGDGRPLLAGDPRAALTRLEALRADAYDAAAHVQVDTDDRDVDAVAADVVARFRSRSEPR